jgi:putative colanic acid biosynthesis UDP-glucose lipid carrier transferase
MRGETEVLEKMQGRIDHDLYYLQNWSIWLDLWIIMRTVWVVLRRDNAY